MRKLITLAACLCIATALYTGCKSTGTVPAIVKAEGVLITSVDTGMNVWKLYVTQHQSDGKVTQAQVDAVKDAYSDYYNAQLVAKAALEGYITHGSTNSVDVVTANTSVTAAENVLLNLLNSYIK